MKDQIWCTLLEYFGWLLIVVVVVAVVAIDVIVVVVVDDVVVVAEAAAVIVVIIVAVPNDSKLIRRRLRSRFVFIRDPETKLTLKRESCWSPKIKKAGLSKILL